MAWGAGEKVNVASYTHACSLITRTCHINKCAVNGKKARAIYTKGM